MKKLLLILFLTVPAQATVYYINASGGSDTNSGTSLSAPWATISKANSTLTAGDTVYIRTGTYGQQIYPANNGSSGSPITYRRYGDDVVTVRGVSGQAAVCYLDKAWIVVDGLTLKHINPTMASPRLVSVYGDAADYCTIKNCNLVAQGTHNYGDTDEWSISMTSSGGLTGPDYVTIENNTFSGWPGIAIRVGSGMQYTVIRGNTITNTQGNAIDFVDTSRNGHYALVENNFIDYCYEEDGIQFEAQPGTEIDYDSNHHVVIRNNVFRYCQENAIDMKGASYIVIENNTLYGCPADNEGPGDGNSRYAGANCIMHGSGAGSRHAIVRRNIVYDNQGGIKCEEGYQVYHNTVLYNNRDYTGPNSSWVATSKPAFTGIEAWMERANINIKNNIVGGHNSADVAIAETSPSLTIDGNLYFGKSGGAPKLVHFTSGWHVETWANWPLQLASPILALGCDVHSYNTNPLLVNVPADPAGVHTLYDFSLQSASPAIDAGQWLTTTSGSGTNSTSMVVANSRYFTDGYGIVTGDTIQLAGQTATVHVTNVNYSTHTLTLDAPLSWSNGQGVALAYSGTMPDIGAKEYTTTAPTYTLTVTAVNGTVTKTPNKSSYSSGEIVTLTATASSGYSFTGWSGDLSGATNPTTITMTANKSVTANFILVGAGPYYVDADATEGGNGLSAATAFNQLADIPASLTAGTHIYLQRGDTFRESLTIASSGASGNPIKLGTYGGGANPVLKGTALLASGWTQEGGGTGSYTESDPTGVLSVTSEQVTWTDMQRNTDTWLYKDAGVDYFGGDFVHRLQVSFTASAIGARAVPWMLANFVDSYSDHQTALETNDALLLLFVHGSSSMTLGLFALEDGSLTGPSAVTVTTDTLYFVSVTRDDNGGANGTGQVTVEIHTGDYHPNGTHVGSMVKDCAVGEQNNFRYVYAIAAKNDGVATGCSGLVQNLDLSASSGANDFSGDPNCVALWRFESGALTTDSKSTNTLTNFEAMADAVNYREGAASAYLNDDVPSDYMNITDAALAAGFPFKSGDTNKKISVAGWYRADSLPGASTWDMIFTKFDYSASKRSFALAVYNNAGSNRFCILLGYNSGASYEKIELTTLTLTTGTWYHVGATYQDSDKSYRIRAWDGTSTYEATGIATNNIYVSDSEVCIGRASNGYYMDGRVDELVVCKDILTAAEIDEVRNGTYGYAAGDVETFLGTLTNVWKVTLATNPDQVFFNGVRGKAEAAQVDVTEVGDWSWSANNLYVFSESNPATAFTSPGIEASIRPADRLTGLLQVTGSYVQVENVDVTQSYSRGISIKNGAQGVTLTGGKVTWSKDGGIVCPATTPAVGQVTIQDCEVAYNNTGQLEASTGHEAVTLEKVNGFTVRRNLVHDNFREGIDAKYGATAGNIYHNVCYANGDATTWEGIIQIYLDGATNTNVYQNLIYGGDGPPKKDNMQGIMLAIEQDAYPTSGINIYSNVIHDCSQGIRFWTPSSVTSNLTNISVVNNTIVSCPTAGVYFASGATNNLVTPLVFKNNILWQDAGSAILDDTTGDAALGVITVSYNGFATGQASDTIGTSARQTGTPGFASEGTYNYALSGASSFVDAGTNAGTPFDAALASGSVWPANVTSLDQDACGAAWEIGAYALVPVTGYENFLLYTETDDVHNQLTVTATRAQGGGDSDHGVRLWKDFGVGYFGTAFEAKWTWAGNPDDTWSSYQRGYTGWADETGPYNSVIASATSHSVWVDYYKDTTSAVTVTLRVYDGLTQEGSQSTAALVTKVPYYFTLTRTQGINWQLVIRTTSYTGPVVAALAVTALTSPAYRYAIPWSGRSDGSAGVQANWYIENLSLTGGAGTNRVPVILRSLRRR